MATFQDVVLAIPGLRAYYPLDDVNGPRDIVGDAHGTIHGNVEFGPDGAKFDGSSEIELPARDFFSAAGNPSKELSILVYQTVDDWTRQSANNEYIHWMGKGKSGAHEWTFRYYCDGCGGEAPQRPHRTSYYNFNPDGGLGTGSYFQDEGDGNGTERVIVGMIWGNAGNGGKTQMWKNGELRDTDMLSDYDVYPEVTDSHVFLGSRGDNTGFLVGRLRRVAFFDRKLTEAEIKSFYDARSYTEGAGSSGGGGTPPPTGGGGGGETPPPTTTPTEVIVGGEVFPVSGVDTNRGSGQLIAYTKSYGSETDTNEWGAEVKVVGGHVAEILDQQAVPVGEHNMSLTEGGYVLSGHGAGRTFLLENATIGVRAGFTDAELPGTPPPSGGGGSDMSAVDAAFTAAKNASAALESKLVATEVALSEALTAKGALDSALDSLGSAIDAV